MTPVYIASISWFLKPKWKATPAQYINDNMTENKTENKLRIPIAR